MPLRPEEQALLADMAPLQALRLGLPLALEALERAPFDPFPDGTAETGPADERGLVAGASGAEGLALRGGPLSGFDGALPDYLQAALLAGMHADDPALRDFLAIFDRRLMALSLAAQRASVLVAAHDGAGQAAAARLGSLTRLLGRGAGGPAQVPQLLPLLSRARNLEMLRRILAWRSGLEVRVSARFDMRAPIDAENRSRLACPAGQTNRLGQSTVLGRFGRPNAGHLSVALGCASQADLRALEADGALLAALKQLSADFLRARASVTFYACISHGDLAAPRLSGRGQGHRLGPYGVLAPGEAPARRALVKLAQIRPETFPCPA